MQTLRAFTMPRFTGAIAISALAVTAVAIPTAASASTAPTAHTAVPAAATTAHAAAAPVAKTPAAKTPAAAATQAAEAKTYTVHSGDTLAGIAASTLGDASRYTAIFDLNHGKAQTAGGALTDPNLIEPGWVLTLPGAGQTSTSATAQTSSATTATKTATSTSQATATTGSTTSYGNNLDGWIKEAQSILAANGVQVSYNAIYQTVMHESAGNPSATNGWDSNAAAGTPSIGLMQTIQPTFNAYALPGHYDIYNPVDNIIAGARYAAAVYGGLDNVVAARGGGSNWYGY